MWVGNDSGWSGSVKSPAVGPYTRALLSAVPSPDPTRRREPPNIQGDLSLPIDPPARCRFYDRCTMATERCAISPHPPADEKAPAHWVACYEA